KMKKEAETYSDADKTRREKVELKNKADTLIYTARKSAKDAEGKVDAEKIKKVNDLADDVEKMIKEDQTDNLQSRVSELESALSELGQQMYQQAQAQQGQQTQQEQPGPGTQDQGGNDNGEGPTINGEGRVKE
ncbi:MAG TPA: Hsp70 family protein, partial [Caldisericia bacterium]|nr:Hsp70 family protein [Caldisericia bacterium]